MSHKRAKGSPKHGRKAILIAIICFLAALLVCMGSLFLQSRITHVEFITLTYADLPPQFDGVSILFASDIDCVLSSGADDAISLFRELAELSPDMLILGGDYASVPFTSLLNGTEEAARSDMEREAAAFLQSLAAFPAPLGKFAVTGENEAGMLSVRQEMERSGIMLLANGSTSISRDGGSIAIAGFGDAGAYPLNFDRVASQYRSGDFVIAVVHSPAGTRGMSVSAAKDGGAWCDLILSGHTHGGQMRLFGRTLVPLNEAEAAYRSGWFSDESGCRMLVSEGVGCENVNLRLGTRSMVHLITLKRG